MGWDYYWGGIEVGVWVGLIGWGTGGAEVWVGGVVVEVGVGEVLCAETASRTG